MQVNPKSMDADMEDASVSDIWAANEPSKLESRNHWTKFEIVWYQHICCQPPQDDGYGTQDENADGYGYSNLLGTLEPNWLHDYCLEIQSWSDTKSKFPISIQLCISISISTPYTCLQSQSTLAGLEPMELR